MSEAAISAELWQQIDSHLLRSEVFPAVLIYKQATKSGIAEAKDVVGTRFREHFPQLWAVHCNLDVDD